MTALAERVVRKASAVGDLVFGKTYELSLVKGYVSHWAMAQAVRELIQNALDSESPFAYSFDPDEDGRVALRLSSEFTTLTPQTLLLGATSKTGRSDAIGSFGEGYKIALLVLTRLGYDVEILNGEHVWRPRFRFSRTFGDELLVIDEALAPTPGNKGLTFIVHGLAESEREEIVASCLKMQREVGEVKETSYGRILLDRPGKLYVGSLFVCDTELRFGYDFKPEHLRLERDRQTVADWDVKMLTLRAWYDTKEWDRVAEMIHAQTPDVEYASYDSSELVREACYRVFRERHPGKLIARSTFELEQRVREGFTEYVYLGDAMHATVSRSEGYRSERPFIERAAEDPRARLERFLREHRDEMRRPAIVAFKAIVEEARKWRKA